tara:strand:- start:1950 stop:4004 length:2055 start_codon:yes stop_codon:yes gene_type:complete
MKDFILFLFINFCLYLTAFSQETVQSKIVDKEGNAIPFATIGIIEKNFGTVTFEDGSFSLEVNSAYKGDTLILSAVGYKRKKVAYTLFVTERPNLVYLEGNIQLLNEVTITPEELNFSEAALKKKSSPNHLGISSPLDGATVAFLIEDISEPVLINEIATTIRQLNMDSIQVRCRIFSLDPETGLPADDLSNENLIAISTMKQQRLTFRLTKNLWLDEPFFVGFEWVMTKTQFEKLQKAKDAYPLDFIDQIVADNSGFSYNVNENKRVQFRDSEGKVVKKVNLTKEQIAILNEKDAASPKLQFKIKMKGTQTYTGSPITGKWSKNPHELLVSVKVGKRKNSGKIIERPKDNTYFSLGDNEILTKELALYLEEQMDTQSIPGLSMVVFNKDEILHYVTKGSADKEGNIPVSETTIFEAASLSKPLFAYLIMKYVDKSILDLDRPLYEYMPYKDIENDERYKKITTRMVLSHTSGFPNWRTDHEDKLFIAFEPGTNYLYSGEGFQYLAKVLAHLLDTDDLGLERAFQKEVASSLGLETTKFLQDANNLSNKAKPYKNGKQVKSKYANDIFGAAFSVHSEGKDFSIWLRALLNNEGLTSESFKELFNDQVEITQDNTNALNGATAWTLGFGKYELGDDVFYGHGGNNLGYTSGFFIDRENQFGAVIFTNADQVSNFVIDTFRFLIEY